MNAGRPYRYDRIIPDDVATCERERVAFLNFKHAWHGRAGTVLGTGHIDHYADRHSEAPGYSPHQIKRLFVRLQVAM